jgi:O-antigen/teichoic acid export membrane protein
MTSRATKASRGLFSDLLQYGVLIVLQVVLAPIILKVSGQEVLGAYSIVMQIIGYGLILDLGLSVALNRYLAHAFGNVGTDHKFEEIFNIGRYFIFLTNIFLALIIVTVSFNIETLIVGSEIVLSDTRDSLLIFAMWILVRSPLVVYSNGLLATQNMLTANIIGIISGSSRLFLSIGLVYFGLGLIGLVVANILSECLALLLKRYYFNKLNPLLELQWRKPNPKLVREIIAFGMSYWGVNIAIVLTVGSDSIVVGHLYGAAAVAVFYTTKIPSFMLIQLVFKISDNAGPAVNELISQGNFEAVRTAYLKILRYSMLVAFPLAIGITCFNKAVISAWIGANQYAGHLMSFALALYVITQVISHINAMITVATGNMHNWMKISVMVGVVTIALAYILGKLFGMQWVMLAIAVMELPLLVFLMVRSCSSIDLRYSRVWRECFLPAIQASIPLILLCAYLPTADMIDSLVTLVSGIIGFSAIWAISSYSLGLSAAERSLIKDKIATVKASL